VRSIGSGVVGMALMSTLSRGRLFVVWGRPRLCFNTPPGPAKRFGGGALGAFPVSSAWRRSASSLSRRICSSTWTLGFSKLSVGLRFSMALRTLIISPSRSPRERIVPSVMSASSVSSILSRSKDDAYRVQSSKSQPADRKKSNQSIFGAFFAGGVAFG